VRPRAKVTIDSLQEVVYEKSIGTKMNDLDLRLEVVSRSLRYTPCWISRKPLGLRIESWLIQRTNNRKRHMGYQMITWPITSRDPQKCCEEVRSAILATAWLLVMFTDAGAHFMQYTQQSLRPLAFSEYRQLKQTNLHIFQ